MNIRVLGCSGGIGLGHATSAYLINDTLAIDAGTGLSTLPLHELTRIDDLLLTHAHMDHIACLPSLADLRQDSRSTPLRVWAGRETLTHLKQHIFNNLIWPDFTRLPSPQAPFVQLCELSPAQSQTLQGINITPLQMNHTVPTLGYLLSDANGSFALCGDTHLPDASFWQLLNSTPNLHGIAIETAYPDEEAALAQLAGHLCPALLHQALQQLKQPTQVYIMHNKPGQEARIARQLQAQATPHTLQLLSSGQTLHL